MFDGRFTYLLASLALTMTTLPAVTGEDPVERVRVDLDFEQLGMLDGGDGRIELEIHCRGARPMHQVAMAGDVLVVQVQALPDASDAVLDLAGVDGIEVSIEAAHHSAPQAPAAPPIPAAPAPAEGSFDDLPPLVVDPQLEESVLDAATPPPSPVIAPLPLAPAPPPAALEPTPGDGLVVTDEAAKAEVMAAMEAAMAEAREENAARLMEASLADETDPDRNSSWVTEREGEVVGVR